MPARKALTSASVQYVRFVAFLPDVGNFAISAAERGGRGVKLVMAVLFLLLLGPVLRDFAETARAFEFLAGGFMLRDLFAVAFLPADFFAGVILGAELRDFACGVPRATPVEADPATAGGTDLGIFKSG